MADPRIVLSATDATGPAFASAKRGLKDLEAQAKSAAGSVGKLTDAFNKTGKLNAREIAQVGFQLQDFAVQVAGGQNALMALVQQGSQLSGTFGGTGNAIRAVVSLLTPAKVLFGGVGAAIAAVGVAAWEGAKESKALADALTISGNAAGLTEGRFNELASSIALSTTATVGEVREFAQALAATGEIGPAVFADAARAAALYGNATGKTAEEVAKDFAAMGRDTAKWAADFNRSSGFITAAQWAQIKALQESGREVEAQRMVYAALNQRFDDLRNNLGLIDRALNAGAKLWSEWWDAAKGIGRAETIEEGLARVKQRLEDLNDVGPFKNSGVWEAMKAAWAQATGRGEEFRQALVQAAQMEEIALEAAREGEQVAAIGRANAADKSKRAIAAKQGLDAIRAETNEQGRLNKKLEEYRQHVKAAIGTPFEVSRPQQMKDEAAIRAEFNKGALAQAEQFRKARLAEELQDIRSSFDTERDAVGQRNAELQALYNAGAISLADHFRDREANIRNGVAAELAVLERERQRIERELQAPAVRANPAEQANLRKQAAQVADRASRIAAQAESDATVRTIDHGRAVKDLTGSLRELQAQALQAQGKDAQAGQLRMQAQLEQARRVAGDAFGAQREQAEKDVKDLERALPQQQRFVDLQEQVRQATERSRIDEEAFAIEAERRGLSLIETERGIAEKRQEAYRQLQGLSEQMRKLAAESGDPKMLLWADQLALALKRARDEIDPTLARMRDMGREAGQSIAGAFEDAIFQGGKLRDVVNSLGRDLAQIAFRKTITEPLAKDLGTWINKAAGFLPGAAAKPAAGGAATNEQADAAKQSAATLDLLSAAGKAVSGTFDKLSSAVWPAISSLFSFTTATQTAAAAETASTASESGSGWFAAIAKWWSGSSSSMPTGSAFGNAFDRSGLVSAFARGGIVERPTLFRYGGAGRLGIMGEAGPEAILPLRRTAAGRLGVHVAGERRAEQAQRPIIVNVQAAQGTTREVAQQQGHIIGTAIARSMRRNG